MKLLRAIVLALLAGAPFANANTFSTDASDIWWNANESGWGVNVIHQNDVMFLTFFVYDQGGRAQWYVAPSTASIGNFTYSGPLYRTVGPWIGTVFNPNSVSVTQVGTATFNFHSITQATLSYTVDGLSVTKEITRQTWRTNNLTGNYTGAIRQSQGFCAPPAVVGIFVTPATISISQSGSNVSINVNAGGDLCGYSAPYTQAGRMGSMSGNFTCTSGQRGTFQFFEIEGGVSGISGRFNASGACTTISGRFAAVRN